MIEKNSFRNPSDTSESEEAATFIFYVRIILQDLKKKKKFKNTSKSGAKEDIFRYSVMLFHYLIYFQVDF